MPAPRLGTKPGEIRPPNLGAGVPILQIRKLGVGDVIDACVDNHQIRVQTHSVRSEPLDQLE